jgi:hypothetical protein
VRFVDADERLARYDARFPATAPHRFATEAEVAALIAELDAKFFPAASSCSQRHHQPCWTCQRLGGAQGD